MFQILRKRGSAWAGGAWSPTDVAGCVLWLDASQITGKSDGDAVTQWNDKSGKGYNFTSVNGPTYKTHGTNILLPALRFDGIDDYLLNSAFGETFTGGDLAIFMVVNQISPVSNEGILCFSTAGANDYQSENGFSIEQINYDGGCVKTARRYGEDRCEFSTSGRTAGYYHVVSLIKSAGSAWFEVDGTLDGEDTYSTENISPTIVAISARIIGGSLNYYANNEIAEIVIYKTVPSSGDIETITNYLKDKYGIK